MYEELIVALNKYFEGYELKRGDALKAAEAIEQLGTELEREKEKHQHTSEVAWAYEDEINRLKRELDIKTRMEQAMTDIAQDFQQQLHDAQDELEQIKQERDAAYKLLGGEPPKTCKTCTLWGTNGWGQYQIGYCEGDEHPHGANDFCSRYRGVAKEDVE